MAKVFHRGRDKGKKRLYYYFNLDCADGKRKQKRAFTDKGKSEQLAAKMQHEEDLRRLGLIDPQQEQIKKRRATPLSESLKEFQEKIAVNTPKHVKLIMSRVRRIVGGCGFAVPSDTNAEAVETFLRKLAIEKNLGPRTYNHYLQAFQEFANWLVTTGRAPTNPLAGLEPLNCEVDIRHRRRALSTIEFAKLVQSARNSGVEIQCFDGETRARIYLLSYMTGLRKKELASLTPRSFSLDATPPTLTIEAPASKNRKRAVLPLHPELVAMVREWLVGVPDDQFLFPNLDRRRGYLMVRKDLERVGIAYETPEGIADFHAAGRHTHITELLRNGVSLPEAMELARHSDVRQTMKYTHIGIDDQAKAIRRLPWHHIGTIPRVPRRPAMSTRGKRQKRDSTASSEENEASVSSWPAESTSSDVRRHASCSFDSRRLHFLEKEALRRERRRAFSLWGIELRRRACSSIG
jgi:integrase